MREDNKYNNLWAAVINNIVKDSLSPKHVDSLTEYLADEDNLFYLEVLCTRADTCYEETLNTLKTNILQTTFRDIL